MKIKSLDYLPVAEIHVGSTVWEDVEVSLYGHWVHIKEPYNPPGEPRSTFQYSSWPASSVDRIIWA